MFNLKLKFCLVASCTAYFIIILQNHIVTSTDDISNHIKDCCNGGKNFAKYQNNCENHEYDILNISPIWRGLCHSTYVVCCSYEVINQYCLAGRLAAQAESPCNDKYNTTSYSDCCRACQIGLAVRTSGSNCNDNLFSYFYDIESFRICCEDKKENEKKPIETLRSNNTEVKDVNNVEKKHVISNENRDGTITLQNDDDICENFENYRLCEHICQNTMESYICKCHSGYKLNNDMVTCSAITEENNNSTTNNGYKMEDDKNQYKMKVDDDSDDSNLRDTICPNGFKNDFLKPQKCVDIDECLLQLNDCKKNQYCLNTNGSFRCLNADLNTCEFGLQYNYEIKKCDGIKSNNMSRGFKTSILPLFSNGLKDNKCNYGFQWKNYRCQDINECKNDNVACDSNHVCVNDIGGYHCNCKIGFNMDTSTNTCIDINECSINNHNCLPTQRCDNTIGSYVCTRLQSCGTGYTLNADSSTCDDNDECALNTHNCKEGWDCYNTKGSFRCYRRLPTITTTTQTPSTDSSVSVSRHNGAGYINPSYKPKLYSSCSTGFQRNYLGACVDIDECTAANSPCGSHQHCTNTNGSYYCLTHLKCPSGYKSNNDSTDCIDLDECESGEHNCIDGQICRNRNGGFLCSCPQGHRLGRVLNSELRCVDINECEQKGQKTSLCPANAQCINTIGSYFCECKPGFQKSFENERICLDVDECNEIPGLCQQKCVNFFGGYRCTCNNGYELGPDNRTCNDIDECEVEHPLKLCMGFCSNVPGSYECSCPRGYILASDRNTCIDIDECVSGEFCTGRNDVCTNKRGGYKCTSIRCPFGYTNDHDQKTRCRLINNICDGEDCYNKPSAYTYNFITFVSKLLIPPEGRTFFSFRGPAWYDDIEFDMKIVKIQTAANIERATYNNFGITKINHEVHLNLKKSLEGPQEIEIDLTMTVYTRGLSRGKSVAKIFIIVSQYSF